VVVCKAISKTLTKLAKHVPGDVLLVRAMQTNVFLAYIIEFHLNAIVQKIPIMRILQNSVLNALGLA
jgi:hypothetical protein